ncbi:MAG: phosphopantothenoylcysteine decarboxylase [Phycisphaerae bacterium]|nr:phosphopantothenoylcysteine decarboxylase [Phycisphaerae bacterium]
MPTTRTSQTRPPRRAAGNRLLVTAGPTHEPIDAVRYLANRSSGRLGIALAEAAARTGWTVTLLLGPTPRVCSHSSVRTERFQTTEDLRRLLDRHAPRCDVLIMAAAVADFRPKTTRATLRGKTRRARTGLTLRLEATPDLLARCGKRKSRAQFFVGFALEPDRTLLASARAKLARKRLDLIVANPLRTMDSQEIRATLLAPQGPPEPTPGRMRKTAFARWLLAQIRARRAR